LRGACFRRHTVPQLVFFAETRFNGPVRKECVDVAAIVAVVASVDAYSFAEELFDCWNEGCAAFW
jgi:hypothetical protein